MMSEEQIEAEGIQAIMYLQKLGGQTETEEQARAGWRALSDHEREFTLSFYNIVKDKQ